MKKFLLFCLVLACLCGTLTLSVFAASYSRVIYDDAGLISYDQEEILRQEGWAMSQSMDSMGISVIITDDFDTTYGQAIYDTHELSESQDMILLVIYYDEYRNYYEYEVVAFGEMKRGISYAQQNNISDALYDDVKAGDLVSAIRTFMSLSAEKYQSRSGERTLQIVGIALISGAVAAGISILIVVLSYRKKNRSPSYPLKEFTSLDLTLESDVITGRNVTKVKLSSSSGGSSGGGSRGGGRSSGRR